MNFYTTSIEDAKKRIIDAYKVNDFNIHNVSAKKFYLTSEKLHHLIEIRINKIGKRYCVEVIE